MSNLGLYPEELDPEKIYFQWPTRTKIQRLYQDILREFNGDQKYLRCPDLQDNSFEVLSSEITQDKIDLDCAETVKAKPTVNGSGYITYSDTINFNGKQLDNSGYLRTQ